MMSAEDYLKSILSPLLVHPDALKITESQDPMGVLFTVECHDNDIGPIIGKGGIIAHAVRQLMRSYGIKNKARISVLIKDPKRVVGLPVTT